jgi:hypothetical protein
MAAIPRDATRADDRWDSTEQLWTTKKYSTGLLSKDITRTADANDDPIEIIMRGRHGTAQHGTGRQRR